MKGMTRDLGLSDVHMDCRSGSSNIGFWIRLCKFGEASIAQFLGFSFENALRIPEFYYRPH